MAASWYKRGTDGLADDIVNNQRVEGIGRLWMPKGASKTIMFCDDEAFRFWEHQLYVDGSWRNWYVCPKKNANEPCPICDKDYQAAFVSFYTIIDKTGYTDRSGNKHVNKKILFPAKIPTLEKLKRQSEKRGGLTGCVFEVTRGSNPKSSSTGDDFDYMEKVTDFAKDLPGIDVTPINYTEIFTMLSTEKLQSIVDRIKTVAEDADAVPY